MFLEVGTRLKSVIPSFQNPGDPISGLFSKGVYATVVGVHHFPGNPEPEYMIQPDNDSDHFDMPIAEVAARFKLHELP